MLCCHIALLTQHTDCRRDRIRLGLYCLKEIQGIRSDLALVFGDVIEHTDPASQLHVDALEMAVSRLEQDGPFVSAGLIARLFIAGRPSRNRCGRRLPQLPLLHPRRRRSRALPPICPVELLKPHRHPRHPLRSPLAVRIRR